MQYPIDPMQLTQGFGGNSAAYARFNLAGHNGWDFRTKWPDTADGKRSILASWSQKFYGQGDEGNDGYGRYVEYLVQLKRLWKVTYAHCDKHFNQPTLNTGDTLGISDNTGNSTGAHLHFTTKPGKLVNGVFVSENNNNGYKGAVDPQQFFDELAQVIKEQEVNMPAQTGPSDRDYRNEYYTTLGLNGVLEIGSVFGNVAPDGWGDDFTKLRDYTAKTVDRVKILNQQYSICSDTKAALEVSNKDLRDKIATLQAGQSNDYEALQKQYDFLKTQNDGYSQRIIELTNENSQLKNDVARLKDLVGTGTQVINKVWDVMPGYKTKAAVAVGALVNGLTVLQTALATVGYPVHILDSQIYLAFMGVATTLGLWGVGAKMDRTATELKVENVGK